MCINIFGSTYIQLAMFLKNTQHSFFGIVSVTVELSYVLLFCFFFMVALLCVICMIGYLD